MAIFASALLQSAFFRQSLLHPAGDNINYLDIRGIYLQSLRRIRNSIAIGF